MSSNKSSMSLNKIWGNLIKRSSQTRTQVGPLSFIKRREITPEKTFDSWSTTRAKKRRVPEQFRAPSVTHSAPGVSRRRESHLLTPVDPGLIEPPIRAIPFHYIKLHSFWLHAPGNLRSILQFPETTCRPVSSIAAKSSLLFCELMKL